MDSLLITSNTSKWHEQYGDVTQTYDILDYFSKLDIKPQITCCDRANNGQLIFGTSNEYIFFINRELKEYNFLKFSAAITSVHVSTTQEYLLVSAMTSNLMVISLRTLRPVKSFHRNSKSSVIAARISPNQMYVASLGDDGSLTIHEFETEALVYAKTVPTANISGSFLEFSILNPSLFACGFSNGEILIFDIENHNDFRFSQAHVSRPTGCAFSPVNRCLMATCGTDGKVVLYDVRDSKRIVQVINTKFGLTGIHFKTGSILAFCDQIGQVHFVDLTNSFQPSTVFIDNTPLTSLRWFKHTVKSNVKPQRPAPNTPGTLKIDNIIHSKSGEKDQKQTSSPKNTQKSPSPNKHSTERVANKIKTPDNSKNQQISEISRSNKFEPLSTPNKQVELSPPARSPKLVNETKSRVPKDKEDIHDKFKEVEEKYVVHPTKKVPKIVQFAPSIPSNNSNEEDLHTQRLDNHNLVNEKYSTNRIGFEQSDVLNLSSQLRSIHSSISDMHVNLVLRMQSLEEEMNSFKENSLNAMNEMKTEIENLRAENQYLRNYLPDY
eukprot:TRINITY_DN1113_c0_g1_i1.p1 TRINITY_DN1113_c0_g1~~TRINITY_DN1113_c0_g1_i1.p1  ORF type:complete len:551 (+),score=101.30 TRINITY_DN1113_c0_g1_i1:680-2332(+)